MLLNSSLKKIEKKRGFSCKVPQPWNRFWQLNSARYDVLAFSIQDKNTMLLCRILLQNLLKLEQPKFSKVFKPSLPFASFGSAPVL